MSEFTCIIWKVEHGSAAFMQCPNGRTIMFDAGSNPDFSPSRNVKQTYSLDRLDWLVVSHPDQDHISDLPRLYPSLRPRVFHRNPSFPSSLIYPSGTQDLNEPFKTYKKMEEVYTHPISDHLRNPPASNWGGVLVKTFFAKPDQLKDCPENNLKNNLSLVSVVTYDIVEIVFPGDLEPSGWDALLLHTEIADSLGVGGMRVLVAPHHGRKSGIRTADGEVYDAFLKIMRPHLVVISDKWGNESTDPDSYRPHCLGHEVFSLEDKKLHPADVITTKTNDFVIIQYSKGLPWVFVP